MNSPAENLESIADWRQWYFVGVARDTPETVSLSAEQLQALFGLVSITSALSCGAALDPRFIINQKGTTVWILLFLLPLYNDKSALAAVANGQSSVFVPEETVRDAFAGHINWPAEILARHPIALENGHLFVIPFLTHKDQPQPTPLERSLRSPDGALEILSCMQLDDSNPEAMMQHLAEVREIIRRSGEAPLESQA